MNPVTDSPTDPPPTPTRVRHGVLVFAATLAVITYVDRVCISQAAPLIIGMIINSSHRNWAHTFWISGAIYFLGGLSWRWLDPVTPITGEETTAQGNS